MSKILPKLSYKLEAGVFNVKYKEEAMGEEFSDSAAGFRVDGGLVFNVTKKFFVEVSLGYLTASDTVIDDGEEYSIKLGGFRTGAGIGIRL
jgi:opacity protein-like surface antigen